MFGLSLNGESGQADPREMNSYERKGEQRLWRRDRFNEKMKVLQELIPHCRKRNASSLLGDAIEYIKALQLQVQMMSTTHQAPYVLPQMQVPPQFSPMQPLTGPRIGMYGLMPSHITTAFRNPLMLMRPLAISHSSAAGLPLFYGTGNTPSHPVHQSLHLPLPSSLASSSGIVPLQPATRDNSAATGQVSSSEEPPDENFQLPGGTVHGNAGAAEYP
ncbi:hypothetical protein RJ640_021915 [Escallonia rubra]|uniref:BHLH domain-containing protein n=1 Tax=Escallonia rubra TaxID=112253 RepID=A0AA88U8C6_9ASTE|nr:hypothetical protein RJ640_021915 [Escallonia rubra]